MVLLGLEPALVLDIGAVELELLDHLGAQLLGGEYHHLVIYLAALAHELHALEQVGAGAGGVVVLGYQNHGLDVIHACSQLEVGKGEGKASDERQHEEPPVTLVLAQECPKVDNLLFLLSSGRCIDFCHIDVLLVIW